MSRGKSVSNGSKSFEKISKKCKMMEMGKYLKEEKSIHHQHHTMVQKNSVTVMIQIAAPSHIGDCERGPLAGF